MGDNAKNMVAVSISESPSSSLMKNIMGIMVAVQMIVATKYEAIVPINVIRIYCQMFSVSRNFLTISGYRYFRVRNIEIANTAMNVII